MAARVATRSVLGSAPERVPENGGLPRRMSKSWGSGQETGTSVFLNLDS